MDVHVGGEAEYPMMLPLLLLSSPKVGLETDVANGHEELQSRASVLPTSNNVSPLPSLILKSVQFVRNMNGVVLLPSSGCTLGVVGKGRAVIPQTPTLMKRPSGTTYTMKSWHGCHSSRDSDIIIIDYGHGNGVRRWGSLTPMISEVASSDGVLGSSSSGLRRMLIPLLLLHGVYSETDSACTLYNTLSFQNLHPFLTCCNAFGIFTGWPLEKHKLHKSTSCSCHLQMSSKKLNQTKGHCNDS